MPFCLAALVVVVVGPGSLEVVRILTLSASHCGVAEASRCWSVVDEDALVVVVVLVLLLLLLRPRNLAVRAETLEMMLWRADEVSEAVRMLLPESNRLGESSDLTDE